MKSSSVLVTQHYISNDISKLAILQLIVKDITRSAAHQEHELNIATPNNTTIDIIYPISFSFFSHILTIYESMFIVIKINDQLK